ncbi:conserved hypothetical protein [Histoplasma capsulatum H143]|uniref:Uncharacterized protein n=1 Tax=Ajellomyces capsulatus (strain H143) TaxID=544712 RepID=C6HQL4_AJECH|nr:conserved hypothetical protein [Histoplasma capsulatum H143]
MAVTNLPRDRTWKTCNFDPNDLPVSQEMMVDLPVHVRLRSAILWNDVLLVKRIIKNNPRFLENPNFDDKSNTSLHLAAIIGNLEIIKLLVSFGHDSCTPQILESGFDAAPGISVNTDGATPLHLAAAHSHTSCVQFLCTQFPQTIDRPDHNGATPLMLAAQNSNASHPAQSTCLIPPKQRPPTTTAAAAAATQQRKPKIKLSLNVNDGDLNRSPPGVVTQQRNLSPISPTAMRLPNKAGLSASRPGKVTPSLGSVRLVEHENSDDMFPLDPPLTARKISGQMTGSPITATGPFTRFRRGSS